MSQLCVEGVKFHIIPICSSSSSTEAKITAIRVQTVVFLRLGFVAQREGTSENLMRYHNNWPSKMLE